MLKLLLGGVLTQSLFSMFKFKILPLDAVDIPHASRARPKFALPMWYTEKNNDIQQNSFTDLQGC